jgi:hypothetical protein
MRQTHVRRYLNDERYIRIAVARSGNPRALVKVRDGSENGMAVVAAAKAIEQLGMETEANGIGHAPRPGPGITILIETGPTTKPMIDVPPAPEFNEHHWPSVD